MNRNLTRVLFLAALITIDPCSAAVIDATAVANPIDFFASPGIYEIDSDTLELTGPGGLIQAGVEMDGVAVFSFDDFALGDGASLRTVGDLPVEIHAVGGITIGGGGIEAYAGGGRGGLPRQRGAGPGGGLASTNFFGGAGGGGGFGGAGGMGQRGDPNFQFPGAGGNAYGDLSLLLQGGSGGGGGKSNDGFQSAGGDGGGGLALRAGSSIVVSSQIIADGLPGRPLDSNHTGGGGGSGGGILLEAFSVTNLGLLSADGGRGGDGVFENGGGGGGGRILINTAIDGLHNSGQLSVRGGLSPSDFFGSGSPGQVGVIWIKTDVVPEPSSLASIGAATLLWLGWHRKRGTAAISLEP